MEDKYCPIIKDKCIKEQCVLYVQHQELCAIMLATEDLRFIAEHLEES
jgi:hypothetical protein